MTPQEKIDIQRVNVDYDWNQAITLEDWVRKAIQEGRKNDVVMLLGVVPSSTKILIQTIIQEMEKNSSHAGDSPKA